MEGQNPQRSSASSKVRRSTPRVALLIETSNAYGRGVLAGVAEFVQAHGPWSIFLPEKGRTDESAVSRLRGWKGDGILVRAEDRITARSTLACRSAVVDLGAAGYLPQAPAVHSDTEAEAGLAFDHLWERGFRHLAFCGVSDYAWVRWQEKEFCRRAVNAGATVAVHVEPLQHSQAGGWAADRKRLVQWLRALPKPVGVFACYDLRGQQLLDACRAAGLRIPDDVAVVGVDDDAVRCSLSDPPLSSVAPDTRRIGYSAAELLSELMAGKRVSPGMRLVPPLGVTARRSTDALMVTDADVATALRFIRDHCCEQISVDRLLDEVPLSRRGLESRFLKFVGRTPHAEILRCRVGHAKQLLARTDLPIKAVAARVGVGTPEYLSVLFRRLTGLTPSAFRAQHQPTRTTTA
jgi:LacI family transcriptional regulator